MATPFVSSASGDPREIKQRWAFHGTYDVPPAEASYVQAYAYADPFAPNIERYESLAISTDGSPLAKLPGKGLIPAPSLPLGDVDPEHLHQLMCEINLAGAWSGTDKTGWYEWEVGPGAGTAVTDEFIGILAWNNVLQARRVRNAQVLSLEYAASGNSNYALTAGLSRCQYDMLGTASQTTGSGSTVPTFIGRLDTADQWAASGNSYKFRYDSVASGVTTWSGARGAGAYNETFNYTLGNAPARVADEDGAPIGAQRDALRFHLPSGATLTATDAFTLTPLRSEFTFTAPTRVAIPSVNTIWYINGEEYQTEAYNVTISRGVQESDRVQGTQSGRSLRVGTFNVQVTSSRGIEDLTIQEALHEGADVSLVVDASTDTKITGIYPYRKMLVIPKLTAEGQMFQVEPGATNRTEPFTLVAGSGGSVTVSMGYGEADKTVTDLFRIITWNGRSAVAGLAAS